MSQWMRSKDQFNERVVIKYVLSIDILISFVTQSINNIIVFDIIIIAKTL